jgi:hypothetical protein
VVKVLVDLGLVAVLAQETTENTHSADPDDLGGETGVTGTTAFTGASVTALALGSKVLANTSARLASLGLANDVTILDELTNGLSYGIIRYE